MIDSIRVTARQVYGETKFYPACAASEGFAAIAGTKTLTVQVLRRIKLMGVEVVIDERATLAGLLAA